MIEKIKAIASDSRYKILKLIASHSDPLSTGFISALLRQDLRGTRAHIAMLRDAGIIEGLKLDKTIYYEIKSDAIKSIINDLKLFLENTKMPKLSEREARPPKILIYGPAGSGKTALATTLGEHLQVIDLDDGLGTCFKLEDKFKEDRMSIDAVTITDTKVNKPDSFQKAKRAILDISNKAQQGQWEFKAICLDSLTMLVDSAMRMVLHNNGRMGKRPQIQDYQLAFIETEEVILMLRALPCVTILLAHEHVSTIDDRDIIQIGIPGKNLPAKIPALFDEFWHMSVRGVGGGRYEHLIQTKSTEAIRTRSRANLENNLNANLGMVELLKKTGYEFNGKS